MSWIRGGTRDYLVMNLLPTISELLCVDSHPQEPFDRTRLRRMPDYDVIESYLYDLLKPGHLNRSDSRVISVLRNISISKVLNASSFRVDEIVLNGFGPGPKRHNITKDYTTLDYFTTLPLRCFTYNAADRYVTLFRCVDSFLYLSASSLIYNQVRCCRQLDPISSLCRERLIFKWEELDILSRITSLNMYAEYVNDNITKHVYRTCQEEISRLMLTSRLLTSRLQMMLNRNLGLR